MNTMLDMDKLRETTDYIEKLFDDLDNTNGAELTEYAAQLCHEINEN